MKNQWFVVGVLSIGFATAAFGAFDPTGYVVLNASDSSTYSSLVSGDHWDPAGVPEAGRKYYVPSGLTVCSPLVKGSVTEFAGDELAVAGDFHMYNHENASLTIPNLRLFHGIVVDFGTGQRPGRSFHGTLTVDPERLGQATNHNYVDWTLPTKSGLVQNMGYDLVGPSTARIYVGLDNKNTVPTGFIWTGDKSAYYGSLEATGSNTVIGVGASDMPGSVIMREKSRLQLVEGAQNTISKLNLMTGATLVPKSGATLHVTNSYVCGGGIPLDLNFLTPDSRSSRAAVTNEPLVVSAGAGTLKAEDFIPSYGVFPPVTFGIAEGPEGEQILRAVACEVVQFTKTPTDAQIAAMEDGKAYAFTDGASIPAMTAGTLYGEMLWTTNCANFLASSAGKTGYYTKNLYLGGTAGGELYGCTGFTQRDFKSYYVRGGLTIAPGYRGVWIVRSDYLIAIDAQVSGSGDLHLKSTRPASKGATLKGSVEFSALNTNFTGRVIAYEDPITGKDDKITAPNKDAYLTLYVTDGRNLGGPLANFTYDALTLSGWARLTATNSVVFDQANRGVFVDKIGQIEVGAGDVMSLCNSLTLNGTLLKKGLGMLALGGTMRFVDGAAETEPAAGLNVVEVQKGWIKPLSAQAFDGAALTFATGTGIRLDLAPADADLAARGLVDVRANGSIGLADGATGKIALAFDGDEVETDITLGVATLPTKAAAEAFRDLLSPVRPRRCTVKLSVVENGDDTATVVATVQRTGLMLIVR